MRTHDPRLGRALWGGLCLAAVSVGCGPAPIPRATAEWEETSKVVELDPCSTRAGRPPPEPLTRTYTGLARTARCQNEVMSIMEGVTAALGVGCEHCHVKGDLRAPTANKRIADWMSLELAPKLKRHDGATPTCANCHASDGRPRAKILGAPRSESTAIEWMNVHMVGDFVRADGEPLRCKTCHGDSLGAPSFQRRLIGTDALARAFQAPAPEPAPTPEPAPDAP